MNKNKIKVSQPNIIIIKPDNTTTAKSNNSYKCKKQKKIGVTTRNKLRTNTLNKTKSQNTIPIETSINSNTEIINLTDDNIIFELDTNKIVTNAQIIIREDIQTINPEETILKDNPIRKECSINNSQNIENNNINNNNNNNNNNNHHTNNYEKVDYRNIATLIAKQPSSEENHQMGFRKIGNSSSSVTNIINNTTTTVSTYHNHTYENNDYEDFSYSYVHKLKRKKLYTNSQKQNPTTTEMIPITTTHTVIRPEPLRAVPLQDFITNQQQIRSPERPASFVQELNQTIILQQPITTYQNDRMTLPQYQNINIYNNVEQPEQQSQQQYQQQQEVDDSPPNTNHKFVYHMFAQDLPFYEQCKENLIQLNQYAEIYDVSDHWSRFKSYLDAIKTTEYQTNNIIVIQHDQTSEDEPKDTPVEDEEILVVE